MAREAEDIEMPTASAEDMSGGIASPELVEVNMSFVKDKQSKREGTALFLDDMPAWRDIMNS